MIERLRELNVRLTDLLSDPHPGLSTWCSALDDVMTDLVKTWSDGVPPK